MNKTILFKHVYSGSKTVKKTKESNIIKVIIVRERGCYDEENAEGSSFRWVMLCISVLGDSGVDILFITTLLNPSFRFCFSEYTLYFIVVEFKV